MCVYICFIYIHFIYMSHIYMYIWVASYLSISTHQTDMPKVYKDITLLNMFSVITNIKEKPSYILRHMNLEYWKQTQLYSSYHTCQNKIFSNDFSREINLYVNASLTMWVISCPCFIVFSFAFDSFAVPGWYLFAFLPQITAVSCPVYKLVEHYFIWKRAKPSPGGN